MALMPFGSPPDKWNNFTSSLGVVYLQPKVKTKGLVIGSDIHSSIDTAYSGISAVFNGDIAGANTGINYFGNFGYGTSFLALGGVFVSGKATGSPSSPAAVLVSHFLGGWTPAGYDGSAWLINGSNHSVAGLWSNVSAITAGVAIEKKVWLGGLLTPAISWDSNDNAIKFNESLYDSDITFYNDTGTTATMDGANGGLAVASLGTRAALSGDSTGGTGTGLVVKSSTNNYTFEYQKSDGSNLLRGVWDTGNFHHYLGGTLYYNIGTNNFVIDGNGNSNIGLILTGGAELKLDSSITGALPNIRMGGGSYATAGTPLTTTNAWWNSVWAWNGSNGYTITSQHTLNHVMLSTTAGDSELRFLNNSNATVMKLGMLNKTMTLTGHSAFGAGVIDTVPGLSALSGTLSANINNYNTFTDGTLTQNAVVLNSMLVDASANNASNWIAQDGLIEIKTGNTKNYTGLVAGDGGAAYHYGSGTISTFDGVFGIVENNSSGTITDAHASRFLSIHYGSGTVTNDYGVYTAAIYVSGSNTTTNRYGVYVENPTIFSGTGTWTNVWGLRVKGQTAGGTLNYGIVVGASGTNTLWVNDSTDSTNVAGGIVFGSSKDTNLYRSAANTLKTDDSFVCADIDTGNGAVELAAGTYTPTRSAEANTDSNVTMTEAQYMRVGATVTVSGRFTADPTLTATATSFEITLPVASNIGAVEDVAGTATCGTIAGMSAEVIGVVANDTAKIQWVSSDITSKTWSYSFTYQVI